VPFAEGNQLAKKLTTSELKEEAYRQYCEHVAEGWPKESWYFEHPDLTLTWQTMETYIKNEPDVFKSNLMNLAKAKRYRHWFGEGKTLMKGGYAHGSPVVWQTIMRNMFKEQKWDVKELEQPQTASEETTVIIAKMENMNGSSPEPEAAEQLPTSNSEVKPVGRSGPFG
jgi:hypothetical protein